MSYYECHDDNDKTKFKGGDVINDYKILKEIGHGAFSVVYKATSKSKGGNFALKCYSLHAKYKTCAHDEVNNFELIGKHENLATDFVEKLAYNYKSRLQTAVILPLAIGDLFYIMKSRGVMPLGLAYDAFIQVTTGLNHLHSKNFAHGDLKPENVLVYSTNNTWCLKLTDFDGLLHYSVKGGTTVNDVRITREYAPPEYILQAEFFKSSDIWSLGCLFYEMCTRASLFSLHGYSSDESESDHSDGSESDKSDDNNEQKSDNDSDEEELSHDDIEHLTMMVNHLDQFPNHIASENAYVLTKNGNVRNIQHSEIPVEDMLMNNGIGTSGINIVAPLVPAAVGTAAGIRGGGRG